MHTEALQAVRNLTGHSDTSCPRRHFFEDWAHQALAAHRRGLAETRQIFGTLPMTLVTAETLIARAVAKLQRYEQEQRDAKHEEEMRKLQEKR